MSPKKSNKKAAAAETSIETPITDTAPVTEPAPESIEQPEGTSSSTKKRGSRKAKKTDASSAVSDTPLEVVPTTTVPETAPLTETAEVVETPRTRKKRVIKKEDIANDLERLSLDISQSVTDKDLLKRFKQVRGDVSRLLKLRNVGADKKERDSSNSGFKKPVAVSDKMRSFLNLAPDEVTRRLDITKALCAYVKNHDLQDPQDRRNIIPDKHMRDLFNMKEGDILTYYSIQQKMKDHIVKLEAVPIA